MKTINKIKSIINLLFITIALIGLNINAKAQTPNAPTLSCGKLIMSWNHNSTNDKYDIQILKNGVSFKTLTTTVAGVKTAQYSELNNTNILEPGNYTFRVRIANSGAYSLLSSGVNTNTVYSALTPSISNITCRSFTASWNTLTSGCQDVYYRLTIYQATDASGSNAVNVTPTSNSINYIRTNSTWYNFTNAVPGYYYEIQIEVETTNGTTTTTNAIIANTGTWTQTPVNVTNVTGLTLTTSNTVNPINNNCNTLNASWDRNPCVTEYEASLYLSALPTPILVGTYIVPNPTTGNVNYSFTNLTPNSSYRVSVQAKYKLGTTLLYQSGIVTSSPTRLPAAISAPSNFRLISQCGRSVTIAWNNSTDLRANGYLLDISTNINFSAGNYLWDGNINNYYQDYNIASTSTNNITINLPSFAPFVARSLYFRIRTKNANNSCNSPYSNILQVGVFENEAGLTAPDFMFGYANEGTNSFTTYYTCITRPHSFSFRGDACVSKCQLKVEMVNADGSLFNPTETGTSAISWTGPQTTNVAAFLYGPPSLNSYITANGGLVCNYNGIGTASNLMASTTSFILAPEVKYGTKVLSTGYHKITVYYWVNGNTTPKITERYIKMFNAHSDFALKYPEPPNNSGSFTNYYFNTSNTNYQYGPGFQCRQFNATIYASSAAPSVPDNGFYSYDILNTVYSKIIFSKGASPSEFYADAANNSQILGEKELNEYEINLLRSGALNLIDVFNSLNVVGNVNYIGLLTGTNYGSTPLMSLTKIMSFGYTAKPTNVYVDYKCANDVRIKWNGNGNASGTVYYVTMGTSYNPNTNTISNFVTSGNPSNVTYNNLMVTAPQIQALFNAPNNTTVYLQITADNGSGCVSAPSNVISFNYTNSNIMASSVVTDVNNFSNTCMGDAIMINNLSYDIDCIDQFRLVVIDYMNGTPIFTSNYESAASFISNFYTVATNVPVNQRYAAGSVQNYINYCGGNSQIFQAYNGETFTNINGNLFVPFFIGSNGTILENKGRYIIKIEGRKNNINTGTWVRNCRVNPPNNYLLIKKDDGTFTTSDYFPVTAQKGYLSKTIKVFANKKKIAISTFNNTNPTSCLNSVYIEFANSVTGFASSLSSIAPLSGSNLSDFMGNGLDLISYANNLGKLNNSFIRVSYTSQTNQYNYVSAIYGFDASSYFLPAYMKSNSAYETEKVIGFNDFVLESDPSTIYTYDHNNHFYYSGTNILVPDNNSTLVSSSNFFGFSGGAPSAKDFQWDNVDLDFSHRGPSYDLMWDKINMFVSPLSDSRLSICEVLDNTTAGLNCKLSTPINLENPVYEYNPYGNYVSSGTYPLADIIMNQGTVDFGGFDEYIYQQSRVGSYCVNTYGNGWRLPTATEIGKEDDLPVMSFSTNPAYFENGTGTIWTSSLWQINNSAWEFKGSNSIIDVNLNNSYLTTNNYVRCVYSAQ